MLTMNATILFFLCGPVLATDLRAKHKGNSLSFKDSLVDRLVEKLFGQTFKAFLFHPIDLGNLTIGNPSNLVRPARASRFSSTARFCSAMIQRPRGRNRNRIFGGPRGLPTIQRNVERAAILPVRASSGDEALMNKEKYAAMPEQLGVVRNAAVVGFGIRGRGLFASRSLGALVVGGLERGGGGDKKKGETVLDMPLEGNALCVAANSDPAALAFASAQHASAHVPAPLAAFAARLDVPAAVRLAMLLHWEQQGGLYKSYYAEALPSREQYANALLLPPEAIPEFQDAKLEREIKEAREDAESSYSKLVLKDEQLQSEPSLIPDLPDFLLALTHVQTRAFDGEVGAGGAIGLMVPFCDLLNHEFDPNCNFELLPEEKYFKIQTRKSVPLDTELCISYGEDLDNYKLQVTYGFNLPGNRKDRVNLPFQYVMGWAGKPLRVQRPTTGVSSIQIPSSQPPIACVA